jgi:hypothetical protein
MNLKSVLVFGAGLHAKKLAKAFQSKGIDVLAFVVSGECHEKAINSIAVHSFLSLPVELKKKAVVACGVFNHRDSYKSLAVLFEQQGFNDVVWPWEYYHYLHEEMGWCYWLEASPKTHGHLEKYRFRLGVAVETHVSTCARLGRERGRGAIFRGAHMKTGKKIIATLNSFRFSPTTKAS